MFMKCLLFLMLYGMYIISLYEFFWDVQHQHQQADMHMAHTGLLRQSVP